MALCACACNLDSDIGRSELMTAGWALARQLFGTLAGKATESINRPQAYVAGMRMGVLWLVRGAGGIKRCVAAVSDGRRTNQEPFAKVFHSRPTLQTGAYRVDAFGESGTCDHIRQRRVVFTAHVDPQQLLLGQAGGIDLLAMLSSESLPSASNSTACTCVAAAGVESGSSAAGEVRMRSIIACNRRVLRAPRWSAAPGCGSKRPVACAALRGTRT